MVIDLPPHIEQTIVSQAKIQGLSVAELIAQKFSDVPPQGDIRRLKGIVQSQASVGLDDMNKAIALGAMYGE